MGGELYSTVEYYSTELYANEARRIIRQHPEGEDMYMYLAFQNVHDPYETAPPAYTSIYADQVTAVGVDLASGGGGLSSMIGKWSSYPVYFLFFKYQYI